MALTRVISAACLVLAFTAGCGNASGCKGSPEFTDTLAAGQSEAVQVPIKNGRFGLIAFHGLQFTVYRWLPDPRKGPLERPRPLGLKDGTYTGTVTADKLGELTLAGVDRHRYHLENARPCY